MLLREIIAVYSDNNNNTKPINELYCKNGVKLYKGAYICSLHSTVGFYLLFYISNVKVHYEQSLIFRNFE
jgi:hypothetical protein